MTDPLGPQPHGGTPLTHEDLEGLIPTYITTRAQLHEAEALGIARALQLRRRPSVSDMLDDLYLRSFHRNLFGSVWKWAGAYRRLETNIGVAPAAIPTAVRDTVEDARIWLDSSTYADDETAVRFHHRLVLIHPFPNGNGRWSRIVADDFLVALGGDPLTWGATLDVDTPTLRELYLGALRDADTGEFGPLLQFVRT